MRIAGREWQEVEYPKLLILMLAFIFGYLIFKIGRESLPLHDFILSSGLIGVFIAGLFYTYGFSSPAAAAIFLILGSEGNIFLMGLVGGFGALLADLTIFKIARFSFEEEIKRLSKERKFLNIERKLPDIIKRYSMIVLGWLIIALPLPDEIGVSILALSLNIKTKTFVVLSYLFNTAGIIFILYLGRIVG